MTDAEIAELEAAARIFMVTMQRFTRFLIRNEFLSFLAPYFLL